jgi:hypothetical protein
MRALRFLLPLLLIAAPLAAQDPRLSARLTPDAARSVQVLVDSARTSGLPVEPLILKALEGQSKNAPADRILSAVHLLLGALRDSRAALGADATAPELTAGASALRAGASAATVSALRRDRGHEVTVPLGVLTDLVARGIPAADASKAVTAMIRGGVADRDFLRLRAQVEDDIRTGAVPATALDRRLAGLPAAAAPRQP